MTGKIMTTKTSLWISYIGMSCLVADPGFSPGGGTISQNLLFSQLYTENHIKIKEFEPPWDTVLRSANHV